MPRMVDAVNCAYIPRFLSLSISRTQVLPPSLFPTPVSRLTSPHAEPAVALFIAGWRSRATLIPLQGSPCSARATPADPSSLVRSLLFLILRLLFLRSVTIALLQSYSARLVALQVAMPLARLCRLRHDPPLAIANATAMAEPPAKSPCSCARPGVLPFSPPLVADGSRTAPASHLRPRALLPHCHRRDAELP